MQKIIWKNIFIILIWHILACYGILLIIQGMLTFKEIIVHLVLLYIVSCLGVTAGSHRLWSHKAYCAKTPMKIILMIFTCIANQKSIYHWARDHRVHHKGSDTNADPHNIENGFFFAHIGWFFYKKHPDVIAMGKTIDFTDLEKDKIVQFQKKYYLPLSLAFCYYLPAIIGHIFFQNMINGLIVGGFTRHVLTLHSTWCVNSFAHSFGYKPYNPKIKPAENIFVSFVSLGEGQHNLHHTKPYNYKASETPIFNFTTYFIDFMYYIGQAYKLKM